MNLHLENIALRLGGEQFHYQADITDDITGIFGLSGAGKTTLMNVICGMETPRSGSIVFNGQVFFDKDRNINVPPYKRNIGVVFQEYYLFPHLNVEKNLRYSEPYIRNKRRMVSFDAVIQLLDIGHLLGKKPAQLSGGERQRVAIGRTLLLQPQILLLDEPFSNLDRNKRKQIISYLLKINQKFGIPLLIISHDLEDILKLTRSLLIIEQGKISAAGNYLDIADAGSAPDLISHKRYINTPELIHTRYLEDATLNCFSTDGRLENAILNANSDSFADKRFQGKRVRLCIYPDDIILSREIPKRISVQNQIRGVVSNIRKTKSAAYITVDCGIELVSEITRKSQEQMKIEMGQEMYCLIKAKAIEIVHIYED